MRAIIVSHIICIAAQRNATLMCIYIASQDKDETLTLALKKRHLAYEAVISVIKEKQSLDKLKSDLLYFEVSRQVVDKHKMTTFFCFTFQGPRRSSPRLHSSSSLEDPARRMSLHESSYDDERNANGHHSRHNSLSYNGGGSGYSGPASEPPPSYGYQGGRYEYSSSQRTHVSSFTNGILQREWRKTNI